MPEWFRGSTLNPDMIMPRAEQWKPQWDRVQRWYGRVNQIKAKSQTNTLEMSDIDLIIAFFQNCYHLRGWLQSCRPDCNSKIDALFSNNFEMAGCRDLAMVSSTKVLLGHPWMLTSIYIASTIISPQRQMSVRIRFNMGLRLPTVMISGSTTYSISPNVAFGFGMLSF